MAKNLSRIKAIQAFEATARNGSYVAAARELSVTPAAVGQQVRALESWLGVPLFRRLDSGEKRLVVSQGAESALLDFRDGFSRIETGVRKLRERRVQEVITVTASQAFVAKWLLPRLQDFTSVHPSVDVRLDVTDRVVDVSRGEADIGVRCGPGKWRGLLSTHLMDEEVFPVCNPSLANALGNALGIGALAKQTLIHDATLKAEAVFPTWRQWLTRAGVNSNRADQGLKINSSAAVIQAAIDGQGVALARRTLVQDDLQGKRLVRMFPNISWPISWSYYAVYSREGIEQSAVKLFHDWLVSKAASFDSNAV
jgi:LysR family transcriptional regulator, glycine cleavage system transcriptional activator